MLGLRSRDLERERKMLVLERPGSSSADWRGGCSLGGVGYAVLVTVAASP